MEKLSFQIRNYLGDRLTSDKFAHLDPSNCLVVLPLYAHHSIADRTPDNWAELSWMSWDPASNARMIDAWMEQHVPSEQSRFRVDSAIAQFSLVEAGLWSKREVVLASCR